ncbi:MAG TPA: hypothetical protein VGX68_27540 [Thermoanaerobaculia bacterium]|nr:hypothetical protein [Thermoanaerobaculia bacterium]
MKKSRLTALAGLLALLAACGAEEAPRLTAAGPRPAQIPRREARAPKADAELAAVGRQSFQGSSAFRCVLHAREGLQINFRTGDPEMPAVAVRIEDYTGSGPYRARLFVTGRSRTGALVTSTGEVNVQVSQRALAADGTAAILGGSFTGSYGGPAGKGSIEGRFEDCRYSAYRDGPQKPANITAAP